MAKRGETHTSRAQLLDPRGAPAGEKSKPAARLNDLAGRKVLLVDNGKLDASYGSYAEIRETLQAEIRTARWRDVSLDLLRLTNTEIEPLADKLVAEYAPEAVVLALADAGVSVQTALLAIAMERRGRPTVVIATPLGARLTSAIQNAFVGSLPMVTIDTIRTDAAPAVRKMIEAELGAVTVALTKPVAIDDRQSTELFKGGAEETPWIEADEAVCAFQDWAERNHIGDGLPLLPPTARRVELLLAAVGENPDTVIYADALTSGRTLRIRDAAANAAMTGCPVESFPVVVAALRAMAKPDYRLSQAVITTHPSGNAVVFSGGDPKQYGLSSGPGCLGPGHRGNASVGRAVSMSVQHVFEARAGGADLTMFGSPAEFTYCLAESSEASPWPSLASEIGDGKPGVFVLKAESPRNILEHLASDPAELARSIAGAATSLCSNNSYIPSDLLVLINPEHAGIFAAAGWTRDDLALAIHNLARMPRKALEGRGVGTIRPRYMDVLDELPVTRTPQDVRIVVAGAPGPQSMVALPWGYSRGQWHPIGRPSAAS